MPIPAQGTWPANVSAVIITPEEKQAQLAQAPPGMQGQPIATSQPIHPQGAPYATIQTRNVTPYKLTTPNQAGAIMTNPNQPQQPQQPQAPTPQVAPAPTPAPSPAPQVEQPADVNAITEVFYGLQAIALANQMGVSCVWKTEDRTPIDLQTARLMIAQRGNTSVYFDFEQLADIPDEDETEVVGEDPYMAAPQSAAEVPLPPAQSAPVPTARDLAFRSPVMNAERRPETGLQREQKTHIDPVSDRERMAWGGVLSTPGQTVYVRPNVIRVEVEGNVKVQKGIKGNVRMMRITRHEVTGTAQLSHATHNTVTGSNVRSPNPSATFRQGQPTPVITDKFPVPKPVVPVPEVNPSETETADQLDEFDF